MAEIRNCETCGEPFRAQPSTIVKGQGKFCSRKCADEGKKNRRIERVCKTCQKVFFVPKCRLKVTSASFCCKACYEADRKACIFTKTCQQCGKTFETNAFQVKNGNGKFCSKECQHGFNRANVPCINCGKLIIHRKSRAKRQKNFFCSPECKTNYFNPIVTCKQCGNEFRVRRSQIKIGHGLYCSDQCKFKAREGEGHPNWNGGAVDYYGPNWTRQRKKAIKRDNNRCQHCGTRESGKHGFDVHHIKPFKDFSYIPDENDHYKEANKLSNLITLCRACHFLAEHHKIPVQPKLL